MEKTITDILIKNSTIVFKWNSISPIWCWQIIKWRTNKTNNKQRALENLFKCRRHLNDCVYADEGVRVSISVRCSLSAHRRVKVYYTQGSSSSIHTVHVWFLYSLALLLYTCACASVYRKAIVLEVHKKRRLAFYYIINIFLFVVIVIIFII